MNSLKMAWRKLFRRGEHTLTRIISLSAGLAFSLLLLSEVFYNYSFDSFYPDADRIYVVYENYKSDKSSDKISSRGRVSGAIGPGLKAGVPGIEVASRLNSLGPSVFYTDDKKSYKAEFVLADEYHFDILPRPVIYGNPKEILKTGMSCMISDKIAVMIGEDAVGKVIELKEYPGRKLVIAGIFKALPENTNFRYDILISMVSTANFTWDGTNNWLGNDRYYTCVRLERGVDPESLAQPVRKMQEVHQDIQRLEKIQNEMVLKYSFEPIRRIHSEEVKDMTLILVAIALSVLLVSLLNYILLTLSALAGRAKTSAIHKAFGARAADLQFIIFIETTVLFIASLAGASLIITTVQPLIEAQLGRQLVAAVNPFVVWPLIILLVLLLFVISYLPGRFYVRIPVAVVFHGYRQKGNRWKLALLFFQFGGAAFILTILIVVILQYNKLRSAEHGYRSQGIYYASTSGMPGNKLPVVLNELRALPGIERVGLGSNVPTEGASGNNVSFPGDEKELFNVADFYWIDENYLEVLNIPVSGGSNFSEESSLPGDYLISRKGADMLMITGGLKNGVTGRQITLSEHGTGTIRGVFPDFVIHSLTEPDQRSAVFTYLTADKFRERMEKESSFSCYVIVSARGGATNNIMKKMTDIMNIALPYRDADVKSLDSEKIQLYASEKGFRTAMLAGTIVVLLITLIGLLGYTVTEANRRGKELAIRKINGAKLSDVLSVFIMDLEYVAIPAVAGGTIAAWYTSVSWMENFASKVPLRFVLFAICGVIVLLLIALIAALNYTIVANRNPVETLRYE